MRLLKNLFSQKKQSHAFDLVNDMIEYEQETDEMLIAAKVATGPSVVLTPAVPLPTLDAAGWFGGRPRLSKDDIWPEMDGKAMCFVAQVELSKLPDDAWSSTGPRTGELAFFIHPNKPAATAFHVTGALETRQEPHPNDPAWGPYERDAFDANGGLFPQWPFHLSTCTGVLP